MNHKQAPLPIASAVCACPRALDLGTVLTHDGYPIIHAYGHDAAVRWWRRFFGACQMLCEHHTWLGVTCAWEPPARDGRLYQSWHLPLPSHPQAISLSLSLADN